ncbi:MAG: hypothetical protein FJ121_12555 [Deltaproteobacteria bacterium]|nr:hypothetical protein [Deltaproteobacteria bacterium]
MEEQEKLEIIDEIKRIERELYVKKSRLAASEANNLFVSIGLNYIQREPLKLSSKLIKEFTELLENIRLCSSGGSSIEDIQKERERVK